MSLGYVYKVLGIVYYYTVLRTIVSITDDIFGIDKTNSFGSLLPFIYGSILISALLH